MGGKMSGLTRSDRKKDSRHLADRGDLEKVIGAAAVKPSDDVRESKAVFQRYHFSLTKQVSEDIDDLLLPKMSRSDVVKAGILALQMMTEQEKKVLFDEVMERKSR